MSFQAGVSGNPRGRPKGSYGGRIQALAMLDRFLARSKNKKLLERALEAEFREDPARFFKTVIMPLLPRESRLAFDHDGVVQWRSLLGASNDNVGREPDEIGEGAKSGRVRVESRAVLTVSDGADSGGV